MLDKPYLIVFTLNETRKAMRGFFPETLFDHKAFDPGYDATLLWLSGIAVAPSVQIEPNPEPPADHKPDDLDGLYIF